MHKFHSYCKNQLSELDNDELRVMKEEVNEINIKSNLIKKCIEDILSERSQYKLGAGKGNSKLRRDSNNNNNRNNNYNNNNDDDDGPGGVHGANYDDDNDNGEYKTKLHKRWDKIIALLLNESEMKITTAFMTLSDAASRSQNWRDKYYYWIGFKKLYNLLISRKLGNPTYQQIYESIRLSGLKKPTNEDYFHMYTNPRLGRLEAVLGDAVNDLDEFNPYVTISSSNPFDNFQFNPKK